MFLFSCGSVKKNITKEDRKIETKTEVKEVTKTLDTTKVETQEYYSNKINMESFIKDYAFEPIDNSKPFFIGSQKYENVKVVNKESKVNYSEEISFLKNQWEHKFVELNNELQILKNEKINSNTNNRDVDKKESMQWLLWVILLVILVILFLKRAI